MFFFRKYKTCSFTARCQSNWLILVIKLNCMTFSTQLSVHLGTLPLLLHRCTDSFKIHAQIYVTLVVCLGCRDWAWRINMCLMFFLVIDVNIVFIEVMILFVKVVKDTNVHEIQWAEPIHIYILYTCVCSSLSVLWPLTTFLLGTKLMFAHSA